MPVRELGSYDGAATLALASNADAPVAVHCRFTVTQHLVELGDELLPTMRSWRGTFRARGLLPSSGAATLALPDGRSGRIIVTHLDVLEGRGIFTGSGDAPINT